MKKRIFLIFLIILALTFVKAEPVLVLQKDSFQPGETLIGEIKVESGEFSSKILDSNIKFYEGRRETYIDFDLFSYNNTYYISAYLSKRGNLTLKISNILYKNIEGTLRSLDIEKQLSIEEKLIKINNLTYTKILSVRPGVLFTSKTPELILENKGNMPFNISYNLENKESSKKLELFPGRPEKILLFNVTSLFSNLGIDAYDKFTIPIIYTSNIKQNESNNQTNLRANHLIFQVKSKENQRIQDTLELFNFANNNISNLKITKSSQLITLGDYKNNIPGSGSLAINISFYSTNQGFFKDNLTINFEENKLKGIIIIPVEMYIFSENTSIENISIEITNSTPSCSRLRGGICEIGQYCTGNIEFSLEGPCCVEGICDKKQEPGSSLTWLIGLVILAALGGGGYYLYKKSKIVKPKSAEKIISEKTDTYEKRVSGNLTRS